VPPFALFDPDYAPYVKPTRARLAERIERSERIERFEDASLTKEVLLPAGRAGVTLEGSYDI
jgi:hypothetical protein